MIPPFCFYFQQQKVRSPNRSCAQKTQRLRCCQTCDFCPYEDARNRRVHFCHKASCGKAIFAFDEIHMYSTFIIQYPPVKRNPQLAAFHYFFSACADSSHSAPAPARRACFALESVLPTQDVFRRGRRPRRPGGAAITRALQLRRPRILHEIAVCFSCILLSFRQRKSRSP